MENTLFGLIFIVLFQCVSGWICRTYFVKNSYTSGNPWFSSSSTFVDSIVMNPCSPPAILSSFRIFLSSANRGRLNLVSSNRKQWSVKDKIHHTQEYILEVIVHVPLDVDVFHLYRRHNHPLPNIICFAPLWQ